MRWPWTKKAVQSKSVIGSGDVFEKLLPLFMASSANTPANALRLYEQSTAVSVPVDWVADPCSDIDPVLVTRDGKFDTSHPVLELLQAPSPDFTGRLFRSAMAHDYLITGESFVAALGNLAQPPGELVPLSPTGLTPSIDSSGVVSRWEIVGDMMNGHYTRVRDGKRARYVDESNPFGAEIRQARGYSTSEHSMVRGQSPLLSASREARQYLLGLLHNTALLEHGGRGSLVFKYTQDFDQDEFDETLRRIRSQLGGASNAGKILVEVAEQLEIQELGTSNRDMDFAALQSMAQRVVALRYHVPLPLITTDASTFANFEASILALYDYAVLPLYRQISDALSDFLLPRFSLNPMQVRIGYDPNQITALMSRRLDELVKRRGLHVESGNELRSTLGREPAGGFDEILVPANWIPAGSDLFMGDNTVTAVL